METEERPVVFRMGSREQALTIADATHIHEFLVVGAESHLFDLRQELGRVLRAGGGEVRVREEWRVDLISILDEIGKGPSLTADQRALRDELASGPILLTDQ